MKTLRNPTEQVKNQHSVSPMKNNCPYFPSDTVKWAIMELKREESRKKITSFIHNNSKPRKGLHSKLYCLNYKV